MISFRKNSTTPPARLSDRENSRGSAILILSLIAIVVVAALGLGVAQLQNVSLRSLFSSAATMQAQHYAKTKMDYLVYRGYNALAAQKKAFIESTEFQDRVVLGAASTDADGLSHRLVTVEVYKDNEVLPRASLNQVFYSNDANRYVHNDSSPIDSISLKYADGKLIATVNGEEKELGGVPVGTILAWYGKLDAIPEGYALCNGANGTPDLRNRFLVGAGDEYALGDTGGEKEVKLEAPQVGSHYHRWGYHNGSNGGYFLTSAGSFVDAPKEEWVRAGKWNGSHGGGYNGWDGGSGTYFASGQNLVTSNAVATEAQKPHENRPPYYAVLYIMRTS